MSANVPANVRAIDKVARPPAKLSTQRFDAQKATNPFATKKKAKTAFSEAYAAGALPCRVEHKTARMVLHWNTPIERTDFDTLVPLCAEGLRETEHPCAFLARQMWEELLAQPHARARASGLVDALVQPLRAALLVPSPDVTQATLRAMGQLSHCVGPALDKHVHLFLTTLNRKLGDKKTRESVEELLQALDGNGGGKEVGQLIKSKVPTYTPMVR